MISLETVFVVDEKFREIVQAQFMHQRVTIDLKKAIQDLSSMDIGRMHRGVINIRRCSLSYKVRQTIITKRLTELSGMKQYPQLVFQSVWALINIVTNSLIIHRNIEVSSSAISLYVKLVSLQNISITQHVIWCLARLRAYRFQILEQKGIDKVAQVLQNTDDDGINQASFQFLACIIKNIAEKIPIQTLKKVIEKGMTFDKDSNMCQNWTNCICFCLNRGVSHTIIGDRIIQTIAANVSSINQQVVQCSLSILQKITVKYGDFANQQITLKIVRNIQQFLLKSHLSQSIRILKNMASSRNRLGIQLSLNSDIIMGKILAFKKYIQVNQLKSLQLISLITPFGDHEYLYKLYKESDLMYPYVKHLKQFVLSSIIRHLVTVLDLAEKFKQKGKNVFVQQLRNEGIFQIMKVSIHKNDQQLAFYTSMILQRFA